MKTIFTQSQIELMQNALDKWGLNAQVGQAVEECAELIVALQKHVNRSVKSGTVESILDEMADVQMMIAQMRLALEIDDDTFHKRIAEKFAMLEKYIENDEC